MNEKEMLGVRLDSELAKWLRNKATAKKCNVSEVLREAVVVYKQQLEHDQDDERFTKLLYIQGAKSAMTTYRLMEEFTNSVLGQNVALDAASPKVQKDIEQLRARALEQK